MTAPAPASPASRKRPPALAILSLAMVAAPFVVSAVVFLVGGILEANPDPGVHRAGTELEFDMNFVIPVIWLASITVGIVAVLLPLGLWRLAGLLAIVAPALEAIGLLALLVWGFSTV